MRTTLRVAATAAVCSAWAIVQAQTTFTNPYSGTTNEGLSAITTPAIGLSNLGADYKVEFKTDGSGPLFINGVTLDPVGASSVPLTVASGSIGYQDHTDWAGYTYTLGTEIDGAQDWTFDKVALIDDLGAENATAGIYNFNLNFIGGSAADSIDVLGTLACVLAVVPSIDVTVTGQSDPSTITQGQTSHLSMTITNYMSRDFVSTTWFTSDMTNGGGSKLSGAFDFGNGSNWGDQTIAAGDSLKLGHSYWTSDATNPAGTYTGWEGVVGGLYNGDWHFIGMNPNATVNVAAVPEPFTVSSVGIGCLLLAIRRRRRR